MAEPFSYQKDIAPFASRLFRDVEQNRFLNTAQRTALSERLLGTMERSRKMELEDEDIALNNELKRVRLSADRLALEDARSEAQQKRDALASAPAVDRQLDAILNDPSLDKPQKVARINRFAMENSGTLRFAPSLYYKTQYAAKAVEPTEEALTPYQQTSLQLRLAEMQRQQEKDVADEQRRAETDTQRKISKEFRAFDDALDVELEEPESFAVAAAEKEGRPVPTAKFKNPIARTRLLSLVKRFTPDQYEEASKLSPAELVGRAFEIRTQLQESLEKPAEKEKPYSFFDQ